MGQLINLKPSQSAKRMQPLKQGWTTRIVTRFSLRDEASITWRQRHIQEFRPTGPCTGAISYDKYAQHDGERNESKIVNYSNYLATSAGRKNSLPLFSVSLSLSLSLSLARARSLAATMLGDLLGIRLTIILFDYILLGRNFEEPAPIYPFRH